MSVLKVKVNGQWVDIPVIKGAQGETGATGPQGPQGPAGQDGAETDVQINGVSIVDNNHVANIPIAGGLNAGVAKVNQSKGIYLTNNDELCVVSASESDIKTGVNLYHPIVSANQEPFIYYGLSKLSGVNLSNQTVTVGVFPDASKTAIRNMLGVTEELNEKAPVIFNYKQGNPITIGDAIANKNIYSMSLLYYPIQAGTGDPSRTNVRAISGKTGLTVMKSGTAYNILFPNNQNIYSAGVYTTENECEIDVFMVGFTAKISDYTSKTTYSGSVLYSFDGFVDQIIADPSDYQKCSIAKYSFTMDNGTDHFYAYYSTSTQKSRFMLFLTGEVDETQEFTVVVPVQTPYTITGGSTISIPLTYGDNIISADVDEMIIGYYADTQSYVDNSIANSIANIPTASDSAPGLVKLSAPYGIWHRSSPNQDTLMISKAPADVIQAGTSNYQPIVPGYQQYSVFYGLSKAAGVDLAGQTVTLGQWPANALVAIQKMLGVYEAPWELIKEITTVSDLATLLVDVDSYGNSFKLSELIAVFTCGAPTTGTRDSFYGQFGFMGHDGVSHTTSFPSLQYITATSTMGAKLHIKANMNAPVDVTTNVAVDNGNTQYMSAMPKDALVDYITYVKIYQSAANKSLIPSGATLKLYGRRFVE